MSFTQTEFFIFLGFIYVLLLLFKKAATRKIILILGNIYFYAYWDYRFLILIFIPTITDFFFAAAIGSSTNRNIKRIALASSLIIDLSILGFFKYFNWFIASFGQITSSVGIHANPMKIMLPLGISFFIFRMISYTVDVYKEKIEPCRSFTDFFLYATFFPIIVSGPISRAQNFIPQLKEYSLNTKHIYPAFRLFVIGLFIKVFVADNIALFVNYYHENYQVFNTCTSWLAAISYSLQIYCDFAGYSNMAIGISLLLGFKIENNFNYPYLSENITEFWRRWHITLSDWIRDYIYIPLGGNKKGDGRATLNSIVAMTACGIWHGAASTFLFWGFIHGLMLSFYRYFKKAKVLLDEKFSLPHFNKFMRIVITFLCVTLAWVFFRSDSLSNAMDIITNLFTVHKGIAWYPPFIIFILIGSICVHIAKAMEFEFMDLKPEKYYSPAVYFTMLWLVIVYSPNDFQPFIYALF